jgi:hypothetical protein
MEGKGFWEDEFTKKVKLISGVNSKIAAEIGTDLKYRLEKEEETWYDPFARNLPYSLNFNNKARLVKEALERVKLLSKIYNESQRIKTNPLYKPKEGKTPLPDITPESLYELVGKETGPIGKEQIQRTLPERYPEISEIPYIPNLFEVNPLRDLLDHKSKKLFYHPGIKGYDLHKKQPVSFGKHNVMVLHSSPKNGARHAAVLIRKLTDPVSYEWYDSHGTSFNNPKSEFYDDRDKIMKIIGTSPYTYNLHTHQRHAGICKALASLRATRPDLTSGEYHIDLSRSIAKFVGNPRNKIENQDIYSMGVDPSTSDLVPSRNFIDKSRQQSSRDIMKFHLTNLPNTFRLNPDGTTATSQADVFAPFVVNTVAKKFKDITGIKLF